MPYPTKTTPEAIVAMAIRVIEQEGAVGLSMRPLATALGITPHALYRYFPDRAALEVAIADATCLDLLQAMQAAVASVTNPQAAVHAAAQAYLAFAQAHPARYHYLLVGHPEGDEKSTARQALWQFVLTVLADATGAPPDEGAAYGLWALLHGFVALEETGAGMGINAQQIEHALALYLGADPTARQHS